MQHARCRDGKTEEAKWPSERAMCILSINHSSCASRARRERISPSRHTQRWLTLDARNVEDFHPLLKHSIDLRRPCMRKTRDREMRETFSCCLIFFLHAAFFSSSLSRERKGDKLNSAWNYLRLFFAEKRSRSSRRLLHLQPDSRKRRTSLLLLCKYVLQSFSYKFATFWIILQGNFVQPEGGKIIPPFSRRRRRFRFWHQITVLRERERDHHLHTGWG